MTIHEEIKDLEHYSDYSYDEAKKIFLNSFLGARMELGRNIIAAEKEGVISIIFPMIRLFNRLKKAIRGIL